MLPDLQGLRGYVGAVVVIDTATPLIYLGTLTLVEPGFLTLADVDVQDAAQIQSTKEVYILEAKKTGVKKNRRQVKVRADLIVSISRLEDVIEY